MIGIVWGGMRITNFGKPKTDRRNRRIHEAAQGTDSGNREERSQNTAMSEGGERKFSRSGPALREGTLSGMGTRAWLWPVFAAVALVGAVALLFSEDFERQAVSAILQAQRDIAAVQEVHMEVEPAALRAAEADLFAAHAAFSERRYEAALDAASRASQAAQHLLASRSP